MPPHPCFVVVELGVTRVLRNNGHYAYDFDAVVAENLLLLWVVRHDANLSHPQVEQDGYRVLEVADVTGNGVHLAVEAAQLVEISEAFALVGEVVEDQTDAIAVVDDLDRSLKLPVAVAQLVVEDVAGVASAVDAHGDDRIFRDRTQIAVIEQRVLLVVAPLPGDDRALGDVLVDTVDERHAEDFIYDRR